jgi:hypothetical protein
VVSDIGDVETDNQGVIRVPYELILKHIDSWPETIRAPRSISVYAQEVSGIDKRLVVNSIDTGYGRGLARTRKLLRVDPLYGQYLECTNPQAPILVELDSMFSNSVNARRPSVRFSIEWGGSVSARPLHQRVRLQDFQVTHDAAQARLSLFDCRFQRRIQPVHTGLMWDAFLPPVIRLLMDAFAEPATYVHPNSWWLNAEFEYQRNNVRFHPRIDLGSVTLRRAFWTAYAGEVPMYRQGEPDDRYLLRLMTWLRDAAIPERCFVRVFDRQVGRLRKDRKPMLLDTANWFLVDVFRRRAMTNDSLVIFTEELPRVAENSIEGLLADRVVEYVFELSDTGLARTARVD